MFKTVQLMDRKLDHILKALTTERFDNLEEMDPFFEPPEMLYKSIEELYAFDKLLKDDTAFNDNMLRWFLSRATKGGAQKEVTGKTKYVLNTLMHKELINIVCWSGKKNEKHELRSCSAILALILSLCQRKGKEAKSVTADDVKHAIKEYFKRVGEENKKLLATGKSIDTPLQ